MATKKAIRETEKQDAIERLREWLKPGDTVYTILRNVSRSGMQREISLKAMHKDGSEGMLHLDGNVALACGERIGKHDGIVVGGCGMDMGFSLVYNLSSVLFREGYTCSGESCRSSEHRGEYVYSGRDGNKRTWKAGSEKDGNMMHKDGGYALSQRWL